MENEDWSRLSLLDNMRENDLLYHHQSHRQALALLSVGSLCLLKAKQFLDHLTNLEFPKECP